MHWNMFQNKWKTILNWYMKHVVIFPAYCILHVGTLLSFPKLIPSLIICRYALRRRTQRWPWTSCWYPLLRAFILFPSCTFVLCIFRTLILYSHASLFWTGYVSYHMLGRDNIRLCYYVFILPWICWKVLTTRNVGLAHSKSHVYIYGSISVIKLYSQLCKL